MNKIIGMLLSVMTCLTGSTVYARTATPQSEDVKKVSGCRACEEWAARTATLPDDQASKERGQDEAPPVAE